MLSLWLITESMLWIPIMASFLAGPTSLFHSQDAQYFQLVSRSKNHYAVSSLHTRVMGMWQDYIADLFVCWEPYISGFEIPKDSTWTNYGIVSLLSCDWREFLSLHSASLNTTSSLAAGSMDLDNDLILHSQKDIHALGINKGWNCFSILMMNWGLWFALNDTHGSLLCVWLHSLYQTAKKKIEIPISIISYLWFQIFIYQY